MSVLPVEPNLPRHKFNVADMIRDAVKHEEVPFIRSGTETNDCSCHMQVAYEMLGTRNNSFYF